MHRSLISSTEGLDYNRLGCSRSEPANACIPSAPTARPFFESVHRNCARLPARYVVAAAVRYLTPLPTAPCGNSKAWRQMNCPLHPRPNPSRRLCNRKGPASPHRKPGRPLLGSFPGRPHGSQSARRQFSPGKPLHHRKPSSPHHPGRIPFKLRTRRNTRRRLIPGKARCHRKPEGLQRSGKLRGKSVITRKIGQPPGQGPPVRRRRPGRMRTETERQNRSRSPQRHRQPVNRGPKGRPRIPSTSQVRVGTR